MNEMDALCEAITEKMFQNEPLALAVALYLNEQQPGAYKEILNKYENIARNKIKIMIEEVIQNEKSAQL